MSMSILLFVSLFSNKIVSGKKIPLYSTYLLSILILILKKRKTMLEKEENKGWYDFSKIF